ncbi:MAG: hypothetical protein A2846_02775 [Candidatus Doudnabacteria bacterium RIFCSPHIGHO2_01_FULL_49_9]|uniref:Outer membrane protein beta-barrel domain-containing protein n=1 Tax=Candidatus Doudnabacteria bacterium RIFCSPHIGHO2_01_FULL_49_9 TaxID=1817827 RepID=A0A1F5P0F0_9BACT|nr:MAG: hypothetical protein A2846_02775 [Candidatus Doudnabacteria bacterium RIFCSPHIGHO2_01_FULL_49_9]
MKINTAKFDVATAVIKILAIWLLLWLASSAAQAQTLTTAETIGKGKMSYFAASNALVAKDFTTLHYGYGQVVYGINDRVDLYAGPGVITAFGRSQVNVTAGANVNLWKRGIAISSFNLLTTGLTKRSESANWLWLNSTVVSKNVKISRIAFTAYSGYSFLVPFGPEKEFKLFTPPTTQKNIPIGAMIPIGKHAVFAEYNYGKQTQAISIGFSYAP